jgi:hypothetical protein
MPTRQLHDLAATLSGATAVTTDCVTARLRHTLVADRQGAHWPASAAGRRQPRRRAVAPSVSQSVSQSGFTSVVAQTGIR